MSKRSIPACAGEPRMECSKCILRQVYPRVCGGTFPALIFIQDGSGLSPRVRGNPTPIPLFTMVKRSIPACAGEPVFTVTRWMIAPVYPRVCGGTGMLLTSILVYSGLSPRVRGNRSKRLGLSLRTRSIPACAGEPLPSLAMMLAMWVYPRVCGGTGPGDAEVDHVAGLSPRVRGNHNQHSAAGRRPGSIPACAGEPSIYGGGIAMLGVYPRVCGGTPPWRGMVSLPVGLSPRVRGNRM